MNDIKRRDTYYAENNRDAVLQSSRKVYLNELEPSAPSSFSDTKTTAELAPIQKFTKRLLKDKWLLIAFIAIVLFVSFGIGYYYLHNKPPTSVSFLPASIVNSVNFPVYLPSKIPTGYDYEVDSANIRNGILFYKITSGAKIITITEQSKPSKSIDLNAIPSYASLTVLAGKAAIGISVGNPAAIIMTPSTLVTINSTKGTLKDTVVTIAQSMSLLNNQASH
jgi:hypothetical protein